ncbi:hypothetical protein [Janthinobacterium sp. HH01]|uniref:hypothetical protein n=1 Tax=Janthinobacterium sp. HH01 TaxID=1198452 RepID=UPI00126801B4|nr:hypothetical protein [Janthinobacterium sp. HH01]
MQAKTGHNRLPTTLNEVISQLRAANAELNVQLKTHKAAVLAHFNSREKAEKQAASDRAAVSRLRKKIAESGKVMTMASKNVS